MVISIVPMPIGTPEMICGQGVMDGELVQANQKRPTGKEMPPRIINRRRVSCGRPAWGFGAKRVFVVREIRVQADRTPMNMPMKGRPATPGLQPLCPW